jgi:hypothetical protein
MTTTIKVSKHRVYEILKHYNWMLKDIQRLRDELDDVDFTGTATYGDEAGMPKAPGGVSKPIEQEILRREKKRKDLQRYEEEVWFVVNRLDRIENPREAAMLDCLLDGYSITAAGKHLNISKAYAQLMRDNIVAKLAD